MIPAALVPEWDICRKIPVYCTEAILKVWTTLTLLKLKPLPHTDLIDKTGSLLPLTVLGIFIP